MRDAARRLVAYDGSASRASAPEASRSNRDDRESSAWLQEPESLELVLDASRFEALLAEAAHWADRISVCVTASQTERGGLPWWGELLARSTKCDRIYLRRGEQAEGWLLHRLHDTGALRLLDGGVKQVAGNLLVFARAGEIRVLLAHIPLEHAVAGAAFGALLSFKGGGSGDFARSCRAQLESSARLARIPTGGDIDALVLDARQEEPRHDFSPRGSSWRVVSEPERLAACMQRLMQAIAADAADTPLDPDVSKSGTELVDTALDGSWGVNVRRLEDGYRVALQHHDTARLPFVLTLRAGPQSAACNALLLEAGDGQLVLVWRGGLLGHSRSRGDLLWSAARLEAFLPEAFSLEGGVDAAQRLAVVAHTGAALRPQLAVFARETYRLGEVFGVEPAPTLGHALADFAALSARQQTLLLWRALIGLGALDFGVATLTAARALCDQGYLRGPGAEPGHGSYAALAELLARASEGGSSFDRPGLGKIRALQPDRGAYVFHDWLECLIGALPENEVVRERALLRLAFERARDCFGLRGERLSRGSAIERVLESTLSSAVRRGLVRRVGAGAVQRLLPLAVTQAAGLHQGAALGQSRDGLLPGWCRALARLTPVQRLLLSRRCGYYCQRETLESVAQRLGLTPERAQQIEAEAWQRIETESDWLGAVRIRLEKALAGTCVLPLRSLLLDDPWWQGIEQHTELAEALLERMGDAPMHCLELGPRREPILARVTRAQFDAALGELLARAAQIATPAPLDEYLPLIRGVAEGLDRDLSEYLRDALEAQFEFDAADPTRVLGLCPSTTEGTGHIASPVAPEAAGVDSEARLRLEDAVRSAFRSARTPLPFSGVAERISQRIDVDEALLGALLSSAPFVQRNADQYGLLSRDVPGGHEAIATALNSIVDALDESRQTLGIEAAFALVQPALKQPWSIELVRSLIRSDPALWMSPAEEIGLRRWEQGRTASSGKLVCAGIPALARSRFDELCRGPLCKSGDLTGRVRAESSRLERTLDADDFVAVSMVRQLGELYERLLEHVSKEPPHVQQLAEAATRYFLHAVACDEDDVDAAGVALDTLVEARAVLVAVLRQLELDWI